MPTSIGNCFREYIQRTDSWPTHSAGRLSCNATVVWNIVEKDDNPQALIVIGDSKQIFVGKASASSAPAQKSWGGNKSYGGNNNNRDRDIKRGMCFNNAVQLIANNPAYHAMDDAEVMEEVFNLTDALFAEYMTRYGNWGDAPWRLLCIGSICTTMRNLKSLLEEFKNSTKDGSGFI